ncbi:MAG: sigma-70 family RNA polymerase sigma factor [Cytophagales bacterium]|nr:sigma-70 family RNA polymerase sigma factor [Cytophagales bacterium]
MGKVVYIIGMEIEAFKKELIPIKDKLFRLAKTMLQNREDAEDALQEIYMKLWKNNDIIEDLKNPEAYAMKIMKNFCLDKLKYRKNKRMVEIKEPELGRENFTPFTMVSFDNLKDLMLKLFSTLPEQQRMIIHMRDIEHYSYEEIEEVTGMNVNAIRVNLSRARKSVKGNYLKIRNYENR